ncbi:MAG TPA: DUF899 family protein [Nannocystaceae bacterium]|nr:DUF899 family protein [Nannocystaceae bacterium]
MDQPGRNTRRYPNESAEYRIARDALLAEEIEVRRHLERVAQQRRELPLGGEVHDYVFDGEHGKVSLAELFGDHDTLVVYNWMFGPQRETPCPMCTSLLDSLDGDAQHLSQRVAFVVIGRSPIERLIALANDRGWSGLRIVSSRGNDFNARYAFEPPNEDNAALNVFVKRGGKVHHFWGDEMSPETADPGQDPRGAPDLSALWLVLDKTPGGRGRDWYPQVDYGESAAALVRRLYAAWPADDRATVESLVADDFHFTSPLDNRLDRATFFARCWPNARGMARLDIAQLMVQREHVYVTYELTTKDGKRFRNTEKLTVREGKVHDVEVYFGWDLPHAAKVGGFIDKPSE